MRKDDMNIAIALAGLAAAILMFGGKGAGDDSGYGGAFPLPLAMKPPGAIETTQTLAGAQGFQISDKILAAMELPTKKQVAIQGGGGYVSSGLTATAESGGGMVSYGGYKSYGTGILEYTTASQAAATKKETAVKDTTYGISAAKSGSHKGGWF